MERLKREKVSYVNKCGIFRNKTQYFESQYDEIYKSRLTVLQEVIKAKLTEEEQGKLAHVSELAPSQTHHGTDDGADAQEKPAAAPEERIVIGTLYKELPAMPNLLKEYAAAKVISGFRWAENKKYTSEGDTLWVEDLTGRIKLNAPADVVDAYVTGVVVAVRGVFAPPNEFVVSEITPCGVPKTHMAIEAAPATAGGEDVKMEVEHKRYVLIVSGINAGDPQNNPICAELLGDWVAGRIGSDEDKQLAASVAHVIVAGNSVYSKKGDESSGENAFIMQAQKRVVESILPRTSELEAILSSMAATCQVDLMPGPSDPANSSIPQQPMKRFLFPAVGQLGSLEFVTNPYCAGIGGKSFLGTSGQNIDNVVRTSGVATRVAALRATLEFEHIAPTAPDTLECFPVSMESGDPMIIRECPDVYFAGNQPAFETEVVVSQDGIPTRLIAVPSFSATHTVVLVDLDTLEPRTMTFDA